MPAARADLRPDPFWRALKNRVNSARMNVILGGPRVYLPGDDIPDREDVEGAPWGRVIVLPSLSLWDLPEMPNYTRAIGWTMKVEFADFRAAGYNVGTSAAAAHEELWSVLDNWSPGIVGTSPNRVLVAMPVYRYSAPDPVPLLDDAAGIWVMSAVYRTELARAA